MNCFKEEVHYWLLFNEINFGVMPMGAYKSLGLIDRKYLGGEAFISLKSMTVDEKVRFQALHHQFIAGAKTVIEARKISPEIKVGCMWTHYAVSADLPAGRYVRVPAQRPAIK